jgi:putative ABC transport system permease protein
MKRTFRVNDGGRKDVDKEIALHIDLRAREFEAAGMSPEAARAAAMEAFGDAGAIASEVHEIHGDAVRERRWRERRDEILQDLRVGGRMLMRSPAFSVIAILTLAIGIGANTAIFSVLRSVLMRPLPYPHSEQLVQIWADHRALGRAEPEWLAPPDYIDIRDQNTTFQSVATYNGWGPDITDNGDPESLSGLLVSGNYFEMLGAKPLIGRLIQPADDDPAAAPVVVISHSLWARRFGSDRSVLGRQVTLNGTPWTVVGVMPPDFRAPIQGTADIVRAVRRPSNSGCQRGCVTVRAIGRMKPGVTFAAAKADLARVFDRMAKDFPETNGKVGSWPIPLHEQITGTSRPALVTLSVAVGLVLLIGCVNLANLLLVRSAARSREIGVRAALGAGRGRILRQLITENALLAAIGGTLGLIIGIAGSRLLAPLVPDAVRRVQEISVDAGVLLFGAGVTVLSAALFGILPAISATRGAMAGSVRGRGDIHGGSFTRDLLVVTQLSLAVVLLVGAGLLMRSFLKLQTVDLGYRASGVSIVNTGFPAKRYPNTDAVQAATNNLLARLRANPAVKSAEVTDIPVLSLGDQDFGAVPVGEPDNPALPPSIWIRSVTPGYFRTMGMRFVEGHDFTEQDVAATQRVAVINAEAAKRYFPGKSAVGRFIASKSNPDRQFQIVGVIATARQDGPNQPYKSELFTPYAQRPVAGISVVIEPASSDPTAATKAFAQALHEVDPLIPVTDVTPIEQSVGEAIALPKLYATLVGFFAAASLLLAALGVYGVMAYSVAQRQREIGVRMALGAAPTGIRRMILGQGGRLAASGLVIGVVAALALGSLLSKLLFGVTPYDPVTLLIVPVVLGVVTLLAAWVPAARAMRMDPVSVIRME